MYPGAQLQLKPFTSSTQVLPSAHGSERQSSMLTSQEAPASGKQCVIGRIGNLQKVYERKRFKLALQEAPESGKR